MSERRMTPNTIEPLAGERIRIGLLAAAVLAFFIVFSFWSGVPAGERALPFWIGVSVLLVMVIAFGWAAWHLLVKPLPAGQIVREQTVKASHRQMLALLLGLGGSVFIIGAFWDEIWHRLYGIPFGEDFFWRPHLLMYFSIAVASLLALAGLYDVIRRGEGTLQHRFRANRVVGLLILVGGFLMFVLPADPIWHAIYGEDLTAWSIPHLLLFLSFTAVLLLAVTLHMTAQPRRDWGTLRQLRLSDALPLLMFAVTSLTWNQFFTTEWDGGARLVQRPEWLMSLLIAGGAAFTGVMANHTLRIFGAATLSGVLALAVRFALVQVFGAESIMQTNAWVLALPSMVLIDLWYAYRRGAWIGAGVAAAVGMAFVLLTVFEQYYAPYPVTNLPVALVIVLVGCVGMSWIGAVLGDVFAAGSQETEEIAAAGSRLPLASLGVAVATVAFLLFFVTTASPPV